MNTTKKEWNNAELDRLDARICGKVADGHAFSEAFVSEILDAFRALRTRSEMQENVLRKLGGVW